MQQLVSKQRSERLKGADENFMSKVKEDKMEYLMQIVEERYKKQGKELSESERNSIYYSILGVYERKNYGAAHSYVLNAELSL